MHINANPENISEIVDYGMDLEEYYINVEWDILSVQAERRVKKYPCCPEPYPGKLNVTDLSTISQPLYYGKDDFV